MASPFSKSTIGTGWTSGTDTDKESLIFDKQSGIVESVDQLGNVRALQTALTVLQAQTALTAVTTAQNFINLALAAGVMNKKGRTFLVTGYAIFTCAGTPQITIALVIGGVTVCTIQTPAIGAAQTNGQINFQFIVSVPTTGAAAGLESHGALNVQGGASLAVAVPEYLDQNQAVSAAVNLTAANNLQITIAATSSLSSAQLRLATIEVLN